MNNNSICYNKDGNKIIYGDSSNCILQYIEKESIDLIFVDPPYNIGKVFNGKREYWGSDNEYLEWCYDWIDKCISVLKPNGSMYLMFATQFMPYVDLYVREQLYVLSRIVWTYDSSGVQARTSFGSLYEPILHCVKNKKQYTFNSTDILIEAKTGAKRKLIDYRKSPPTTYNTHKVPGNVWYFPRVRYKMPEYRNHPTQKPEALLERIILASSNIGDVVMDPFAGTFTTSTISKKLKRKFIGIEIEEEYVKIGIERVNSI